MIKPVHIVLCIIIGLITINAQKEKTGIHKLQSMYYKSQSAPILEKVTVLNGIDVLLEKKLHFIQSRKIALVTNHSGIDPICPGFESFGARAARWMGGIRRQEGPAT